MGILTTEPSEGARNLSRIVFDFVADDNIPHMSLQRATAARQRILSKVPDFDLQREEGPLRELLERLKQRILSFR